MPHDQSPMPLKLDGLPIDALWLVVDLLDIETVRILSQVNKVINASTARRIWHDAVIIHEHPKYNQPTSPRSAIEGCTAIMRYPSRMESVKRLRIDFMHRSTLDLPPRGWTPPPLDNEAAALSSLLPSLPALRKLKILADHTDDLSMLARVLRGCDACSFKLELLVVPEKLDPYIRPFLRSQPTLLRYYATKPRSFMFNGVTLDLPPLADTVEQGAVLPNLRFLNADSDIIATFSGETIRTVEITSRFTLRPPSSKPAATPMEANLPPLKAINVSVQVGAVETSQRSYHIFAPKTSLPIDSISYFVRHISGIDLASIRSLQVVSFDHKLIGYSSIPTAHVPGTEDFSEISHFPSLEQLTLRWEAAVNNTRAVRRERGTWGWRSVEPCIANAAPSLNRIYFVRVQPKKCFIWTRRPALEVADDDEVEAEDHKLIVDEDGNPIPPRSHRVFDATGFEWIWRVEGMDLQGLYGGELPPWELD